MTFTYSTAVSTDRDKVRLMLGDTDPGDAKFSDEEIAGALAIYGTTSLTAAALADSLAAKYSGRTSISVDGLSVNYAARVAQYSALADRLRSASAGSIGEPFVGGIRSSEMDAADEDTDRVAPAFSHDMHINPNDNPVRE